MQSNHPCSTANHHSFGLESIDSKEYQIGTFKGREIKQLELKGGEVFGRCLGCIYDVSACFTYCCLTLPILTYAFSSTPDSPKALSNCCFCIESVCCLHFCCRRDQILAEIEASKMRAHLANQIDNQGNDMT